MKAKARYSISVLVSKTNQYHVMVHKQRAKNSNLLMFGCWFSVVENGRLQISCLWNRTNKFKISSTYWSRNTYIQYARKLLIYWFRSKHAWSRGYTDWWHVRDQDNGVEYKLYDCSLHFVNLCTHKSWAMLKQKPSAWNNYLKDAHSDNNS